MFTKIKKKLFKKLKEYDNQNFDKKLDPILFDHIKPKQLVLDVGCGDGRFARFLSRKFDCHIYGVDVVNYLYEDIPFTQYMGEKLPFGDHQADVAICKSVIHHTDDPEHMLVEMARAAKTVILIEDYCSSWIGKIGLHLNDYFTNILQNLYKCWCGYLPWSVYEMSWLLKFRTEEQLKDILMRNKIKLLKYKRTTPSWKGMSFGIYVFQQEGLKEVNDGNL